MLVDLSGVSKVYDSPSGTDPVVVLRDLDLKLPAGESLAVVGPSGSGKSTLLNLIGALETPTGGTVRIDGHDVSELDEKGLAAFRNQTVGFVFQLHHLLPQCTVLENVLLPTLAAPGSEARAELTLRAEKLIRQVGLANRGHHRPAELSGGERQRVAVARALVNQPKLLLADEPTGSLDHANADRLADLLEELNREHGITLLLVTHSRELAARANRTLQLEEGRLLAPLAP
ncbi:MAG: ABC transporter ATP-binding protein [Verrucomicrobiota bacterium]